MENRTTENSALMHTGETATETPNEERAGELTTADTASEDSGGRTLSTEDLVQAEPDTAHTADSADTAETTETAGTAETASAQEDEPEHVLFDDADVERFNSSWQSIQTAFVDDPQRAVKEADELVAHVIQTLAATFSDHKSELESAWSQGEPATEDLRIALRRYRSFFKQLLRS